MNRFVKDMLMSKYDKRNSQGDGRAYSSNDSRQYSSNDTMLRNTRYAVPDNRYEYGHEYKQMRDNADRGDYRGYDRDYNRDYNRGYDRGENRGYDRDYNRGYDRADYNRDYGRGNDYGEYGKLSHQDIEKWKRSLLNSDGTMGEHFKVEQIEPVAKRLGIRMHEMGGEEVFTMVVNMMYADYCDVAKKFGTNTPDFYVSMAKAFLEDKDFKGRPEEKVWIYYKCIAEQE